jgi:hypothetical protein
VLSVKALALVLTAIAFSLSTTASDIPTQVGRCLAAHPDVAINRLMKPTYLKVHFRGLKRDYVVAVRETSGTRRTLAMFCSEGGSLVFGGVGQPRFSDMLHDAYMSSDWRICRQPQIAELKKFYPKVPDVTYEGVCLTWEDGEGLIYWNGHAFRFASLHP